MADQEKRPPPDDYQLMLAHYAHRIAVVNNEHIEVCAHNGCWYRLPLRTNQAETSALMALMSGARALDQYPPDQCTPSMGEVFYTVYRLYQLPFLYQQLPGVRYLSSTDFNLSKIVHLRDGSVLDLNTGNTITPNDPSMPDLLLTKPKGKGINYRPELLANPPQHAIDLANHYGYELIDRMAARLAGGATRDIDTILSPLSGSGKDTFVGWMRRALPGMVIMDAASKYFTSHGERWTVLERHLTNYWFAFANECDASKTKEISAAFITRITGDELTDERKGYDAVLRWRIGNLFLLGAAAPNIENGQGVNERLAWAGEYQWPVLPAHLRTAAMKEQDVADWLGTYLITKAMDILQNGDPTQAAGAATAKAMADDRMSDEATILWNFYEPADNMSASVTLHSVRETLKAHGVTVTEKDSRITKWMKEAVPGSKRSKPRNAEGKREPVYLGVQTRSTGPGHVGQP